jgi:glucose-1-phosphate cytidylyltransferase
MTLTDPAGIPVFVLAGGLGTRLKEQTEFRPKPMVEIGTRPILWHIMRRYARFGFRRFIVCAGYRAEVIADYFLHYAARRRDVTVSLLAGEVWPHATHHDDDWDVTVAWTGETAMTGARVARAAEKYLGNAPHFALTYGDGLCDADLAGEFAFHQRHGALGTLLAVRPPARFGELRLDGDAVAEFAEKPERPAGWISGGYFFFRREALDFLDGDDACVLEHAPLHRLAEAGELRAYRHDGFWACMDSQRDKEHLEALWAGGRAPWAAAPC